MTAPNEVEPPTVVVLHYLMHYGPGHVASTVHGVFASEAAMRDRLKTSGALTPEIILRDARDLTALPMPETVEAWYEYETMEVMS